MSNTNNAMMDMGLRILVFLAAAQQVIVPFFVNPFTADRPDRFSNASQLEPAGYAFSIWGPIYLLALCYSVWQLTPPGRDDPMTHRIAPLALWVYVGSSLWLYAAKYGPVIATVPILALMAFSVTLILFWALQSPRTGFSWWLVVLPFALYSGWTVCATFVNIAEVAPSSGFNRFGLSVVGYAQWTLVVVACLSLFLVWRSDACVPFAGTFIWALVAISIAGYERQWDRSVVLLSSLAAVAVFALVVFMRWPWQSRVGGAPVS